MLQSVRRKEEKNIFEKYRIVSCISNHKDSTVWIAEHIYLNEKRIIKGIRLNSPLYSKLIGEAQLMKNLKHPCIPEIYDLEKDTDYTYIIEQYIPGDSLKVLCKSRLLSSSEVLKFIIQISSIIDYLHSLPEKIIYLDIKPENIILYNNQCYLIDFGSARTNASEETVFLGSVGYAAPEQLNGQGTNTRSDIYSLGKLLLYLVDHSNLSKRLENDLRKLADRCLKTKFWNRISTVTEFVNKLTEMQKKTVCEPEAPIKIAVLGVANNVGTTHVSLLLGTFIAATTGKCAFVETKASEVWSVTENEPTFQVLPSLTFHNSKQFELGNLPEYSQVLDCGPITAEISAEILETDCVCLLVGRMAWEKDELLRARALSQRCRNRIFLINLTDHVEDDTAALLKGEKFAAIPYINEFGDVIKSPHLRDIFSNIVTQCRKDSYVSH